VTELGVRAEEVGLIARAPSREDHCIVYLRLTRDGENLLRAALTENERSRYELMQAFQKLQESFAATESIASV
jgi:DNA-binding MarR family transcriptional regulator